MAKEIAKKSSKEALKQFEEQFENRSNKLQISYKQAVLYENRLLKDRSQDFEVLKSLMISFIRGDMESEFFYGEFDGKGGDGLNPCFNGIYSMRVKIVKGLYFK